MIEALLPGVAVTALAGLIMGTSPWPLKLMRRFQYEHFGFISMLVALLILPWTITLLFCPQPFVALGEVKSDILWTANAFTLCWGIAQVLAMLCFVRIGVSLTYGILCSIGAAVGVIVPMVVKASGVFQKSPDLWSTPGKIVMLGTAILLVGVVFASLAGVGRERSRNASAAPSQDAKRGGFAVGLLMVVVAGVLSAGWGFAFTYSQDTIIERMMSHGARWFPASIAVWTVAFPGAAIPNLLYPAILVTREKSLGVLAAHPGEIGLSILYGTLFFASSALLGVGFLLLGEIGAPLGWGLVQGTLILGGQLLGFLTGEWRGVHGKPRWQIYAAILLLIAAMTVMACAKAAS